MNIKKTITKCAVVLLLSLFVCSFTGCELYNLIRDAVSKNYQGAKEVSVIVLTPYPTAEQEVMAEAVRAAESDTERVRNAFFDAFRRYNNESSGTKLMPRFFAREQVRNFYEEDLLTAKKQQGDSFEVRDFAREYIRKLRKYNNDQTINVIIFGVYSYKRNATADKIQLIYYDYHTDNLAKEASVITRTEGRDREAAFENLMYSLIKKVYN